MTLVLWAAADALLVGQGGEGEGWAPTAAVWWTGRKICPSARSFQLSFT